MSDLALAHRLSSMQQALGTQQMSAVDVAFDHALAHVTALAQQTTVQLSRAQVQAPALPAGMRRILQLGVGPRYGPATLVTLDAGGMHLTGHRPSRAVRLPVHERLDWTALVREIGRLDRRAAALEAHLVRLRGWGVWTELLEAIGPLEEPIGLARSGSSREWRADTYPPGVLYCPAHLGGPVVLHAPHMTLDERHLPGAADHVHVWSDGRVEDVPETR